MLDTVKMAATVTNRHGCSEAIHVDYDTDPNVDAYVNVSQHDWDPDERWWY